MIDCAGERYCRVVMKLHLIDLNPEIVREWRSAFAAHPEIDIIHGSILAVPTDALVSPANSHGFMDGGIDLVYLRHFGHQLQERVRAAVYRRREEMVPVGSAELIHTGNAEIPFLIMAPTMEMPEAVPSFHARRAFAAVLRVAEKHDEISEISCPGLCTGVGMVSPEDAAREMEIAYREWKERDLGSKNSVSSS